MGPRLGLLAVLAVAMALGCQHESDPTSIAKDVAGQTPPEVRSRPADPPINDGARAGAKAGKK